MKVKTLAVVGTLGVLGCSPTPESTFNEMKKSACAGDVQGFWLRVNRTRLEETMVKSAMEEAPKDKIPESIRDAATEYATRKVAEGVHRALDGWEDDVKKAQGGDLCRMTFVSTKTEGADKATVYWKTASGKDKTFAYQRFGDRWLVVAVDAEERRATLSPTPATPPAAPAEVVTLAAYEQIKPGMTYEQAVAILGSKGTEQSRSDMAGIVTVMYTWNGASLGANMNAMFQNNKLVTKAQFGLR